MEIVYANNEAQAAALNAIIGERAHQDTKWGTVADRPKQVGSYLTLMRKLLRDAEDAWATSSDDILALDEMRKVVAVGVACFEQHGAPLREQPTIKAPPAWQAPKDPNLSGLTNTHLHTLYDRLRSGRITTVEAMSNGLRVLLTRSMIDTELTARGDAPIPF